MSVPTLVLVPPPAKSTPRVRALRFVIPCVAAAIAVAALFAAGAGRYSASQLPIFGAVPPLQMRDQHARTVTAADLQGGVNIIDFFFTSCPVSCPRLTRRLADVQQRLEAERDSAFKHVNLVSISVDPENDTPARLLEYARRFGAHDDRWTFLTGPGEDLHRIIVDGFKMEYQSADPALGIAEVMHGNWFVLTDRAAQIRGYYLAESPAQVDQLLRDARALTQM